MMLRTSGYVDDVMFSYDGLIGALCVLLSGDSVTAKTIYCITSNQILSIFGQR